MQRFVRSWIVQVVTTVDQEGRDREKRGKKKHGKMGWGGGVLGLGT